MTNLRFNPSDLPEREALVFVPKFRGVSGSVTFEVGRTDNAIHLGARAKLGILLFKNAFDFEATSGWERQGNVWALIDYKEINHKNGKVKTSAEGISKAKERQQQEQLLDPASFLYALRQNPLRDREDKRVGHGVRLGNPIKIEFSVGGEKKQTVPALGAMPRDLLKLELLIETPKSPDKIPVFRDGRSGFWIDKETNIPVEISYEIPPVGALTVALDKVERS